MRRRRDRPLFSLAKALLHQLELVILDEPTSGLDTAAVVLGTGAEHEEWAWQVGLKCRLEPVPLMRSGRVTSLPDAGDQRATAHIIKMALDLVIGYMRFREVRVMSPRLVSEAGPSSTQ